MVAARKPARRRSHGGLWLLVLLVIAAGLWTYTQRRPVWERAVTALSRPLRAKAPTAAAVVPTPTPPLPVANCGEPLPPLPAGALAESKQATFATVEQLIRLKVSATPSVYRVQARLLQYNLEPSQQYHLVLASLVRPALTVDAIIPAGRCVSNQDDGALFDELREDIDLRFGPAATQPIKLAHPAEVMVTGVAFLGPQGVELRPVLDFRVQQ